VSDVVSRQGWLRRCARAGSARGVVIVVASSSFVLLAPANAGPALIHDRLPTITYTISGIRGTNGWYRGSRSGNYAVLRWTVHDPQAVVVITSGCRKEIIKPTSGSTRTCSAASDNGFNSVTTRLIKVDGDPSRTGRDPRDQSAREHSLESLQRGAFPPHSLAGKSRRVPEPRLQRPAAPLHRPQG